MTHFNDDVDFEQVDNTSKELIKDLETPEEKPA